jgi:hypothetical protein
MKKVKIEKLVETSKSHIGNVKGCKVSDERLKQDSGREYKD